MTDEIFRRDGYGFEFEANVESVDGELVMLDSTAFYPGGGGQVCDTGSIRGCAVTEVFRNEKSDIVHRVPGNDLKVGERVWCSVDWDRRYDLMQGHTGEHLLFCSLRRQCPDLTITKIYISPESKYVIVNHDLTWDQIRAATAFANQAIVDNLPVTRSIMDRDDPDLEKVRIKLERIPEDEEITVVAIGDIDLSACSGIHVMETSELEMLIVDRKVSAGADGVAIHFKVGQPAKDAALALATTALEIVDGIGCKAEDAPRSVANTRADDEQDEAPEAGHQEAGGVHALRDHRGKGGRLRIPPRDRQGDPDGAGGICQGPRGRRPHRRRDGHAVRDHGLRRPGRRLQEAASRGAQAPRRTRWREARLRPGRGAGPIQGGGRAGCHARSGREGPLPVTEAQNTYLKNDKGNQRDMSGMRVNDRQMKQAMKKMGIKQSSVDGVTEVIIRTRDKEIVVKRAEVICIEMGGTKSFQVSGETEERMIGEDGVAKQAFPEDDISLVMSQTGCDRDKAIAALEAVDGQPAEAIIKIMTE